MQQLMADSINQFWIENNESSVMIIFPCPQISFQHKPGMLESEAWEATAHFTEP